MSCMSAIFASVIVLMFLSIKQLVVFERLWFSQDFDPKERLCCLLVPLN